MHYVVGMTTDHANSPTADEINAHLAAGHGVMISTYGRATVYRSKHAGWFTQGADGNLYVRSGRRKDCLTMSRGACALVSIRFGFTRTA